MCLTDIACKNARPMEKPYKKTDGQGLFLHVMPNGSKYWRMNYRYAGKPKLLALGVYPEVSLGEAREKVHVARKLLSTGVDPSQNKQKEKLAIVTNSATTFELVAREWHEHSKARWTPMYGQDILKRLETGIFPKIGKRPIADITPVEVLATLRDIEKRGVYETARRTMQYCGQIFRYAVMTGRCERNPTTDLKGGLKPFKKGHFAAIEAQDLPEFLHVFEKNDARLYIQTRNALRLLMLTFVRTGELIGARWPEFDLKAAQWTIPAERMKMRRPHIVPLSKQALDILHAQKTLAGNREWVFPNQPRPQKHMSNNTILFALRRLGYQGRMTGHGFRALAMSTIKEKLGYRHEVVDRQLAHAQRNKVDAAYDCAQFLDERRKMMQEWADYLDKIASEHKVIKVDFA